MAQAPQEDVVASDPEVDDGIHYLRTDDGRVCVVVTPSIEDGPFLSVSTRGRDLPWSRSAELAVPLAAELDKTVRWCDEATNQFMEKQGTRPHHTIKWP